MSDCDYSLIAAGGLSVVAMPQHLAHQSSDTSAAAAPAAAQSTAGLSRLVRVKQEPQDRPHTACSVASPPAAATGRPTSAASLSSSSASSTQSPPVPLPSERPQLPAAQQPLHSSPVEPLRASSLFSSPLASVVSTTRPPTPFLPSASSQSPLLSNSTAAFSDRRTAPMLAKREAERESTGGAQQEESKATQLVRRQRDSQQAVGRREERGKDGRPRSHSGHDRLRSQLPSQPMGAQPSRRPMPESEAVEERKQREHTRERPGSRAEQIIRREEERAADGRSSVLFQAERRQREQQRKAKALQLVAGLQKPSRGRKRKADDAWSAEKERRRRAQQQRRQHSHHQQKQLPQRQPQRSPPASAAVQDDDETEDEDMEMMESKYAEPDDAAEPEPEDQRDDRKQREDETAALASPTEAEVKDEQEEEGEEDEEWIHSSDPAVRKRIIREIREGWKEEGDPCMVCMTWWPYDDEKKGSTDEIVICDGCELCSCYGLPRVPFGSWHCSLCAAEMSNGSVRCAICYSTRKGAFKRVLYSPDSAVNRGEWAHIACAFWSAGVGFTRSEEDGKEAIQYIEFMQPELYSGLTACEICGGSDGAKLKCSERRCERWFHALCGLERKWIEDFWYRDAASGVRVDRIDWRMRKGRRELRPYCNWHGPIRFALLHLGREKSAKERKEEKQHAEEMRRRREARRKMKRQREEAASIGLMAREEEEEESEEEEEEKKPGVKERKTAARDEVEDDEEQPGAPRAPSLPARREVRRAPTRETVTPTTEALIRLEEARERESERQEAERKRGLRLPVSASSSSSPLQLLAEQPASFSLPSAASQERARQTTRDALAKAVGMDKATEIEEVVYARRLRPPPLPLSSASSSSSCPVSFYTAKMRSLAANLRLEHNKPWRQAVLESRVTAEELVSLDERQFASAEIRQQRRRNRQEAATESIRPDNPLTVRRRDGAIVRLTAATLRRVDSHTSQATESTVATDVTDETSGAKLKTETDG